jgi:CelD/BcsL family acetyltransferase involved in cellulose biosynthesis
MALRFEDAGFRSYAAWEAAAATFRNFHFYHSAAWLAFLEATQPVTFRCYRILDGGAPVGYLPGFSLRKGPLRIFGSPFPGWTTPYLGPVFHQNCDPAEIVKAAIAQLRADGFHHAEISHFDLDAGPAPIPRCWRVPQSTFVADVAEDEEAILASFSKSGRKGVRRALSAGVTVELANDEKFVEEYYGQLQQVFAKSAMRPTYPKARVQAIFEHVAPTGRVLATRVLFEGNCIASRIDFLGNGRMHSFGSASDQSYLHLFPNELARYFVMCQAAQRGVRAYDMTGGGAYKAKFNGQVCESTVYVSSSPWLMAGRSLVRRFRQAQRKRRAA